MYAKIYTGIVKGVEGILVEAEVDVTNGFPQFHIVGMPSNTIKEAKERVRTGLVNIGYKFPYKRIVVNLAPAHIKKNGVGFDLPIAVGVLACENLIKTKFLNETFITGEIALNGEIRPVKGILALIEEAKKANIKRCIIPFENVKEAKLIKNIELVGVNSLKQVVEILNGNTIKIKKEQIKKIEKVKNELDFKEIYGQKYAKRAAEIAVSGMHHLLMVGEPGSTKTMIAKRIVTIMPELSSSEILELTKVYSSAGKLLKQKKVIDKRPFRAPHYSITRAGFIGGGTFVKPGEISLAVNGVLLLDEFPEFKKEVIESLRTALEDGYIVINRNNEDYRFPVKFLLVAAMNPCPCGYYPSDKCNCLPREIVKYQNKISGPILDRIDMIVKMRKVCIEDINNKSEEESSTQILERVKNCYEIQEKRYENVKIKYNSQLNSQQIKQFCIMENNAEILLNKSYKIMKLSFRGYNKIIKLARTIADMERIEKIKEKHIAEAITYRM